MKVKVRLVMMSHLSDVQMFLLTDDTANERLDFVKFLLLKFPNTDTEIDADAEWALFQERVRAFH